MLFHGWIFVIFFIFTLALYYALNRTRVWHLWLLIASYFFYGWLNPLYPILVAWSTIITYIAGRMIPNSNKKKFWISIGILNCLLLLGFFKYSGFAVQNLNTLLKVLSISLTIPEPGFLLPVGISFYSFISIGYLIDVYRSDITPERSIVCFALCNSFFPYLLAGPIERARNILPQLKTPPEIRRENFSHGLSMFFVGLFKKLALADFLSVYVNKVYGDPTEFGGLALLVATYAFTWQIYFDFSGYTDMARGCAKILGFDLMLNFNNPYLSTDLGEFWRRWHISLSSWFRDYLYIPLGGNRRGKMRTYWNMIITMLVAGLWHGAAWTFVIWGGLHALGRSVTRELESTSFYRDHVPKLLKQLFIFHFVCLTWIFFRAETLGKAVIILKGIFLFSWSDPNFPLIAIFLIIIIWAYQFMYESSLKRVLDIPVVRTGLMFFMILYLIFFRTSGYEVFYYFRF